MNAYDILLDYFDGGIKDYITLKFRMFLKKTKIKSKQIYWEILRKFFYKYLFSVTA